MIKLNPKIYDLINWLKKNLKTHIVSCLEKNIRFHIFNCYLASLQPTLGHYQGVSLFNLIFDNCIITILIWGQHEPHSKVGLLQASWWPFGENCRNQSDQHRVSEAAPLVMAQHWLWDSQITAECLLGF